MITLLLLLVIMLGLMALDAVSDLKTYRKGGRI